MSRHCYRTTTLEFYELVPETRNYSYGSVHWPLHMDSYGADSYFSNLQNHLAMASNSDQHREFIYDIVQYPQQQAIFEFGQQEEPRTAYLASVPIHEDQTRNMTKDDEYKTSNVDAVAAEPKTTNKPRRKKNIYRAKQGYLVEEPSSESENDQEAS
ncbi:uncharacterized protein LOC6575026 [Drosophila mojavensis]|uniref:Uncharacterized protein n=1 Tax=Drosophila mojavensis TaxID=7230 RepID=B4K8C9_DROMO|nr:uncharacterized protein LOC6575026 [Drosophila mojavensis]EDW16511.1 uncharacterized protein Dmoj_GI22189 [Drosophila mojavensis]